MRSGVTDPTLQNQVDLVEPQHRQLAAALQRSLAYSMVLTLVVVPAIYVIVGDVRGVAARLAGIRPTGTPSPGQRGAVTPVT